MPSGVEVNAIGTETDRYYTRWVNKAIEIRNKEDITMNRDEGQYHLSHHHDAQNAQTLE